MVLDNTTRTKTKKKNKIEQNKNINQIKHNIIELS